MNTTAGSPGNGSYTKPKAQTRPAPILRQRKAPPAPQKTESPPFGLQDNKKLGSPGPGTIAQAGLSAQSRYTDEEKFMRKSFFLK